MSRAGLEFFKNPGWVNMHIKEAEIMTYALKKLFTERIQHSPRNTCRFSTSLLLPDNTSCISDSRIPIE